MYLEHVQIENIRSIAKLALDFGRFDELDDPRHWTVLAGENGTGKSTVLRAIALALAGSDHLPGLIGEPGNWVRRGETEGRVRIRLRTQAGEQREMRLSFRPGEGVSTFLRRNTENLTHLDDALAHAQQNYFVVAYGPYRRVSADPSFLSTKDTLSPRAQSMATLFDGDRPVHPIQSWAMRLDYRDPEHGLGIVRDALRALLPDVEFSHIDRKAETLVFTTPDGSVPLEQLSDGYKSVAAWIGDLLYRVTEAFAHHNEPLRARGILIVDEIDAHLHPAWQRRLRSFLDTTLPNFQILASTHSALTLQQSHEGDAIVLARDASGSVVAEAFPGDPSKLRLHQIYDLAFHITSLDSWEVESSKQVFRALSRRVPEALDPRERDELARARETLEMLPDQSSVDVAAGNEAMQQFFEKLEAATSEIARRVGRD